MQRRRRLSLPLITAIVIIVLLVIAIPVILVVVHNSQQGNNQPGATSTPIPGGNITAGFNSPYGFTVAAAIDPDLIARYRALNITWVREQLPWNKIETSPGSYNWSTLDRQIQLADANGLHVSFVLQG